jgi:hypothetical protein
LSIRKKIYINEFKMSRQNQVIDKEEIASLGASLRQINPKIMKNWQKGQIRLWYQGNEPYFDVIFEIENDELTWFQFTLRSKSLSWDRKKKLLQTGLTDEFKINDVSFYPASKTIEQDAENDWKFVELVKSILETRSHEKVFATALVLFN